MSAYDYEGELAKEVERLRARAEAAEKERDEAREQRDANERVALLIAVRRDAAQAEVVALHGADQSLRSRLSSQCQLTNDARSERDEAKRARDDWHRTADLRSGEIIRLETQRDAAMGGYGVQSGPMREFYPRVIARLEAQVAQLTAALRDARANALEEAAKAVEDTEEVVLGRHSYEPYNDTQAALGNAAKAIRALAAPASAPQAEPAKVEWHQYGNDADADAAVALLDGGEPGCGELIAHAMGPGAPVDVTVYADTLAAAKAEAERIAQRRSSGRAEGAAAERKRWREAVASALACGCLVSRMPGDCAACLGSDALRALIAEGEEIK